MNRKQFIEKNGATCSNWYWSWSFINEEKKQIIFGAWDSPNSAGVDLIFTYDWEFNHKKQRNKGFGQSREHIRLIEEEGYELYTFKMYYSDEKRDVDGEGPAKISSFEKVLVLKKLVRKENSWYAADVSHDNELPEEIFDSEEFYEGKKVTVSINSYERSSEARERCLEIHGYKCKVCEFDFESFYGVVGSKYIHVHHIVPLYEINKEYKVSPEKDLIPVCANCHAIIHRGRKTMSIKALKKHIESAKLT